MNTVYNGKELKSLRKGKTEDKYFKYVGQSFDLLTVTRIAGSDMNKRIIVEVLCECGKTVLRALRSLLNGQCKSCGCNRKKRGVKTQVGDTFTNIDGETAEVIEVKSANDIVVKFKSTGNFKSFRQQPLLNGNFKNPLMRSVYGVGYIGEGPYTYSNTGIIYKRWQSMLQRCYDKEFQKKHPTYIGCEVVDEWHNLQNFTRWFLSRVNYKESLKLELDKDLLQKGNRIYGPNTCTLLIREINLLISTNKAKRGKLPIGVIWHKRDQEYRAQMTSTLDGVRKNIHITSSSDPDVCFNAYKNYKEETFKRLAEKYKETLEPRAYVALVNRKVEIYD